MDNLLDPKIVINLKTKFNVELYFYLLDIEINYLRERFQQMHNFCDNFKFYYNIRYLKNMTKNNIMKNCMDLLNCFVPIFRK